MEDNDRGDLRPFFEPRGVVIVGARRSPGFGFVLPLALQRQGWGDRLFLVNPAGGELHGMPLYPGVAEVPGDPDLAVVIVPAEAVPRTLEELGERGIRHVVIESAGFTEVGEEGRERQERCREAAARYGMRIIGPNCVGVINTANRFSTVELVEEALTPGPVGVIAQSGVFGNILLDGLHQRGVYISKAVTLGNRMDVDECEVLEYMHGDPGTRLVMMYLEGAADGRRLVDTLRRVTPDKPVLILKSGRTGKGREATASHTGSMSGEDALYEAAFRQAGAVRARSLDELVDLARVFSTQPLPRGNRLGIATSSGSLGALATDAAVEAGLLLPPLGEETTRRMRAIAPRWMNVRNPLDVGPSGAYLPAMQALLEDPGIDMVLSIMVIPFATFREFMIRGVSVKDFLGSTAGLRELAPEKPLVACSIGDQGFLDDLDRAVGPDVPVLHSPERAARALAALHVYRRARERLAGRDHAARA
ncbi:MAG: CoA-binding protein [Actinobacteria bacterium]|nr:CoA-binding protein [Actinomycetota bacterium]